MYRKGNFSFIATWNFYSLPRRGGFTSDFHISAVNWWCCLPFSGTPLTNFFILYSSLPWILRGCHIDRWRGMLLVWEEPWVSQIGMTKPCWTQIHIHLLLTLVLLFHRCGIHSTCCWRRLGSSSFQIGWASGIDWWFYWLLRWFFLQKISLTFWLFIPWQNGARQ